MCYGMFVAKGKNERSSKMSIVKRTGSFSQKLACFAAAFLLVLFLVFPISMEAGECENAFARCSVDAALAGMMGGPAAFAYYMVICYLGYAWCLQYYQE